MRELKNRLGVEVQPVENVGWKGDALEAQAFGYLAVRSLLGLSLSLPSTTGVDLPLSGGVLFRASSKKKRLRIRLSYAQAVLAFSFSRKSFAHKWL